MSANAEMLRLYWNIGRMVAARQAVEGWGAAVIPRLAVDLRNDLPGMKGFSERNIRRMIQFFKEYPALFLNWPRFVAKLDSAEAVPENRPRPVAESIPTDRAQPLQGFAEPSNKQRVVAQLPWAHNVILIEKLKDLSIRLWYARQAIAQGWSRDTLALMIKSNAHERQGAAVTNFESQLPEPHAQLAQDTLKDPYIFDFLTLDKPIGISEYELTKALPEELQSALPTIEEIEAELEESLKDEDRGVK